MAVILKFYLGIELCFKMLYNYVMDKISELKKALVKNEILNCYKINSHTCVNNFLQGSMGKGNFLYYIDNYDGVAESELYYEKFNLKSEGFFTESIPYNPVTSTMVEGIMLLDALFRASEKSNHKPLTVYRGISSIDDEINYNTILSTSLDKYVAYKFAKSKLLEFNLPENFPMIDMRKFVTNTVTTQNYCAEFDDELEILLPPCKGKLIKQSRLASKGSYGMDIILDYLNVELTPLSLAQEFLKRMKDLPESYPSRFVNDKDYEFSKSKRRLERYVKDFVMTDKIPSVSDIIATPSKRQFGE